MTDQFAVGAQATLNFVSSDGENFNTLGLQPFVRYYFNRSGNARFFGQGSVNFQSAKFEGEDSESAFGFGLGAGIDYFFNQHVALEAILGYGSLKGEDDDEATGTFGLTIGVAAFIGGGGSDKR